MKDPLTRRTLMLSLIGAGAATASATLPALARPVRPHPIDLQAMLPAHLGQWTVDENARPVLPDEDVEKSVADAYDAWVARVYRRPDGKAVMLVIAYGTSTSRTLAVHRPETCYTAQGFSISNPVGKPLAPPFQSIIARQLTATRGARVEPVLYWMTVAGRQTGFGISQNLALLRAAWEGRAPDAYLIRISTIEPEGSPLLEGFVSNFFRFAPDQLRPGLGI